MGAMRAGMWRCPHMHPNGSVAPAAAAGTQGASPAPPLSSTLPCTCKVPWCSSPAPAKKGSARELCQLVP